MRSDSSELILKVLLGMASAIALTSCLPNGQMEFTQIDGGSLSNSQTNTNWQQLGYQLKFGIAPSGTFSAGQLFSPQPIVSVLDAGGNLVPDSIPVNLLAYGDSHCTIPMGEIFSASSNQMAMVNSVGGSAVFADANAHYASTNLYLGASYYGSPPFCSSQAITIAPGPATRLVWQGTGHASSLQFVEFELFAQDAFGNTSNISSTVNLSSSNGNVSFYPSPGPSPSPSPGTSVSSASMTNGRADFFAYGASAGGASYSSTLSATAPGLSGSFTYSTFDTSSSASLPSASTAGALNANDFVKDGSGNLYFAGSTGSSTYPSVPQLQLYEVDTHNTLYSCVAYSSWPGQPAVANGLAFDSVSGRIYIAGIAADSHGTSYFTIGYYLPGAAPNSAWLDQTVVGSAQSIAVGPYGVYAGGYATASSINSWRVRKSVDGVTFADDDTGFAPQGQVNQIYAASNGDVYAVGFYVASGFKHWLVRKFTYATGSWATIDGWFDTTVSNMHGSYANGIVIAGDGTIHVVGSFEDGALLPHWTVRSLYPWTASWNTQSGYSGNYAKGTSISMDGLGGTYISVQMKDSFNWYHSQIFARPAGEWQWLRQWDSGQDYQALPAKVRVDHTNQQVGLFGLQNANGSMTSWFFNNY